MNTVWEGIPIGIIVEMNNDKLKTNEAVNFLRIAFGQTYLITIHRVILVWLLNLMHNRAKFVSLTSMINRDKHIAQQLKALKNKKEDIFQVYEENSKIKEA